MARSKTLRQKITEAADFLARTSLDMETARTAQQAEDAGITDRLDKLREEVGLVSRREREAQEEFRARKWELDSVAV